MQFKMGSNTLFNNSACQTSEINSDNIKFSLRLAQLKSKGLLLRAIILSKVMMDKIAINDSGRVKSVVKNTRERKHIGSFQ